MMLPYVFSDQDVMVPVLVFSSSVTVGRWKSYIPKEVKGSALRRAKWFTNLMFYP